MNKLFTLLTAFFVTCSVFAQQNHFVVKKKWSKQQNDIVITQETFKSLTDPSLNIRKIAKMSDAKSGEQIRVIDDPTARMYYENLRLVNPVTGKIPFNIQELEKKYVLSASSGLQSRLKSTNLIYTNSGPKNVGGRTRALAIDKTNNNTILAGGVSGGLWKSTDNGATWRRVTAKGEHPSIVAIAQDPRDGHTNTWYYVTGEFRGNSAAATGAFYVGNGVYKSTDNGDTWNSLASTASNTPIFNNRFDICWNVCVNPTNGDVYVATYGGIKHSTDGGATWATELNTQVGDNHSSVTDIICTEGGTLFATCNSTGGQNTGIFVKEPGQNNWVNINPNFMPANFSRLVLGHATSIQDRSVIYVLGYTPGSGNQNNSLWRLDYNGAANWTNLSANIPSAYGQVGGFNSQGGYDLIVKVAPNNPNMVFIGGTNLFRSDNGFTSTAATYWIGGYSTANNVSRYPNHHPDIHSLAFKNDNRTLICGHDGGLSLTTNFATTGLSTGGVSTPVVWSFLNNGYITTQSYTVSIDQNNLADKKIISGFQDNGTWYGEDANSANDWHEAFSGDGSYCAIINRGTQRLNSAQGGIVFLQTFGANNWTRVDPNGASGMLFVNPFIVDSNDDNIMFFSGGSYVWRNTNISEIPKYSNNKASKNWKKLTNSQVNGKVSALASSVYPANILYYGSSTGKVYKMTDSNNDDATATDITAASMPKNAYVSYIAINPTNADDLLVTFSNYKVQSVFHSTDGGTTWAAVGGNLEPSNNNGPSVRTAGYMVSPTETTYFLGTSTGLYSTKNLNGNNTKWTQQAVNKIGTTIVDMLKIRRDGFFAIGTHGNGVFSADADFSSSKPLANFGYNNKVILPGESVNFINQSIGDGITSYAWTFEGAETPNSSDENPKNIVYKKGGQYTVTLTVTNAQGSSTKTVEKLIVVAQQFVADFAANKTQANVGDEIAFTDESSETPTSWHWSFPGATPSTSTNQNPKVVYNKAGTYTVTLKATKDGVVKTAVKKKYITIIDPDDFDDRWLNNVPIEKDLTTMVFKNNGGYVTGHNKYQIDKYAEKFTIPNPNLNGVKKIQINPSVIKKRNANPHITIKIWNGTTAPTEEVYSQEVKYDDLEKDKYNTIDLTKTVNVKKDFFVGYTISYTQPIDSFAVAHLPIASSNSVPNSAYMYYKGSWSTFNKLLGNNSSLAIKALAVYNDAGAVKANFAANKTQINVGEQVTFTDSSTGEPTAWNWTFDGATPNNSNKQNPKVTYNTPGTYDVTLTVSKDGKSDTKTMKAYIVVMEDINVDFTANKTTVKIGEEVAFTDNSTGAITNWDWSLNGGTPAASTIQNPKVTYNTPGTYDVTLKVTDKYGTAKSATKTAYITVEQPEPPLATDFVANATQVKIGTTVKFTDKSEGNPTAWNWTFDGATPNNSAIQNPEVVYNTPGTYDVTLTVSKDGKSDTKTRKAYIVVMEEVNVDFTANKTTVKVGEEVAFTDNSTGAINNWNWTLNGGTPAASTMQNPKVVYNTPGTYDVTLKVTDKYGTAKSATKTAYITVEQPEPPLATDFVANATQVKVGTTVKFTDKSEGNPTAWNWTFDGAIPNNSAIQNPEVVYNTPGTYDVTLTISKDGKSDTKTRKAYIVVMEEVNVNFAANKTTVMVGEEVAFTDNSTGAITNWEWNFNGGNPTASTVQNPKVTYNTPGTYDVMLKVTDKYGTTKSATKTAYITVKQPEIPVVANFIASSTKVKVGETVKFTDTSKGNPTAWDWTFDGATPNNSTIQNPEVVYNTPGTYDVTLTVSKNGKSNTETKKAYITVVKEEVPLNANFTADVTQITAGETVTFTDNSTGNPTAWNWTFNGGNPDTANTQNPKVVYNTPGTYSVSLTITKGNKSDTKTRKAYIIVMEKVAADFTANKTTIMVGEEVAFTDNSTGAITNWEWTFNGGTPAASTIQNPKVVYNTAGTYNVTLKVTDKYGTAKSETKTAYITVEQPEPPLVANFIANATQVKVGTAVKFTDKSEGNPTAWNWTFDGATPNNSTIQNPEVVYNTPGTYNVTLTVSKAGKSDTKTMEAYIVVMEEVNVDFAANKTTVKVGEEVAFTDNSTGAITNWEWTFSGATPNNAAIQNPKVVYNTAGTYNVTLKVTDKYGTAKSATKTAYITVEQPEPPLVAKFTADKIKVEVGESIQFTNASEGNPTTWNWSFPGGTPNTSVAENPVITYHEAGKFDVTLTIGKDGESNTVTKKAHITVVEPAVSDDEWLYNVPKELQNSLVAYSRDSDGYFTGQNSDNTNHYAERFELPSDEYNCVTKIQIAPAIVKARSKNAHIVIKIWTGKRRPNKMVYSQKVALKDLKEDQFNIITLDQPVLVKDVFYVGYRVKYKKPMDLFAIYHTPVDYTNATPNTAYQKYDGRHWLSFHTASYFNFSLAIKALVGYRASATDFQAATTPEAKLEQPTVNNLTIYPNPMSEQTRVAFPNKDRKEYRLVVVDASGKVVRIINNITNDNFIINRGKLRPGVHILNLSGEKIYRGKLLVK